MLDNAYALVVGIANYKKINRLPEIVLKDAQDVCDLLTNLKYCGYPSQNVRLLLDAEATKASLVEAFTDLAQKADSDSTVFIYISGHGGRIAHGSYAGEYLLPVDVEIISDESLNTTAISGKQFTEFLQAISARKVVIVFDCCHAGGIGQPKDATSSDLKIGFSENYYDALKQGRGRAILASSRSSEYSYILPNAENSLFTQYLLSGLRGEIIGDDGLIRIFDVFEYLQPRVTAGQANQHPIFKADLEENFPIALYLGGKKNVDASEQEEYRYDAYISYVDCEPDSTWVWDTLIPRLEETNLRVAVSGDSEEPGVARVVNMERGIRQSKRTIVVLSQAYLNDVVAGFENILGQTMGIQEGTYRLLPVQSEPIDSNKLPTRLSMLSILNLSHPRRAEKGFERLVSALQGPLPRM
ncbi:caspase family protein [Leptothoe sp. PORK10 BA2]|uniref:caspase family protein n=1 Tax=Leptothoe sp. PORK10 BA2 TaxID=3110254 RepID=UPI002B1FFE60|nr:caspase family protein [Leptothoe sp. PORK10 BA2]MEA5464064.1 caspase family protein [Leptothoe sp. PORK10 BA2]